MSKASEYRRLAESCQDVLDDSDVSASVDENGDAHLMSNGVDEDTGFVRIRASDVPALIKWLKETFE